MKLSVVIPILLTMVKLNVILKLVSTYILKLVSTSPLTKKRANNNKRFSVKDHFLVSGHVSQFDFTVLDYESHKFKHLVKEFLLITKDKSLLNKRVKSLKLEPF